MKQLPQEGEQKELLQKYSVFPIIPPDFPSHESLKESRWWTKFVDFLRVNIGMKPLDLSERWVEARVRQEEVIPQVKLIEAQTQYEEKLAKIEKLKAEADAIKEDTRLKRLKNDAIERILGSTPAASLQDILERVIDARSVIEAKGGTVQIDLPIASKISASKEVEGKEKIPE